MTTQKKATTPKAEKPAEAPAEAAAGPARESPLSDAIKAAEAEVEQVAALPDEERKRRLEEAQQIIEAQRLLREQEEREAAFNAALANERLIAKQAKTQEDAELEQLDGGIQRTEILGTPGDLPEVLFVTDQTAVRGKPPRTHELLFDGEKKEFTFEASQKLELPFAVAARFLIDPAFIVQDEHGRRYRPAPRRVSTTQIQRLRADQVIADLGELSTEALYLRCAKMPDGEKIRDPRNRNALIEFLTRAHEVLDEGQRARDGTAFDRQDIAEDMDDESTRALLASV